jgi:hypothetical protein
MAHFAHLNSENKVVHVSVVSNDIETSDGPLGENDMHVDGETWCQNFHGDKPWTAENNVVAWKQCSYNGSFRKQMASINGTYDPVRDEFVNPANPETPSWTLNATNDWVSPLANNPSSGSGPHGTIWQEDNQRWVSFRAEGQENPDVWNPSTQQWDLA